MLDKLMNSLRSANGRALAGDRVRAVWNGVTIAESDQTVVVEGNHYFPRDSVDPSVLVPSDTTTSCPWKGRANYSSIEVGGEVNKDAAWYYPTPSSAAAQIKDRVAFWKGVRVERVVDANAPTTR